MISSRRLRSNTKYLLLFLVIAITLLTFSGCNDDDDEQPLSELVLDAGDDLVICVGESATLMAAISGGDENYTFEWSNSDGESASITVSPAETTAYSVTVTDGQGNTISDSITVTVAEPFTIDAGTDQAVLAGSSVTLGGDPTVSTAGTYSFSWSNGASAIANPEVTPTETTTYTLTVTDEFGCTETDEVVITVSDFAVNAGDDVTICLGTSATLGGSPTVAGDGTYTISWDNGGGSDENPVVSPVSKTTYTVTVTDENGLTVTDEVVVSVAESFIADAGEDIAIFSGETITLGGSPTASGNGTYTYTWNNGAEAVSNPEVTPTETTTYTVTATDEFGCTETDEVVITVSDFSIDAGADITICKGASTTLGGSPTVTGSGTYTLSWDNGLGSATNPEVKPTEVTTYTLTVTDENGLSLTDEVVVSIAESFSINAGGDMTICPGDNATLGGSPTVTGSGTYTYGWNNNAGSDANPVVTPTSQTTYTLIVTDEFGCTETDQITVSLSADFTVDAGTTQQICEGESVTLGGSPSVSGTGSYTYSWSDGSSEVSTDANPTITPVSSAVYTVTVTDDNGCSKTSSVEIGVTPITSGSVTFTYTGGPQTFTFPDCITEVTVEVYGAQGEDGESLVTNEGPVGTPGVGGNGALATGTITRDSNIGSQLEIFVGGRDGYNGGGAGGQSDNSFSVGSVNYSDMSDGGSGGGASDIRYGGINLSDRIIVAAGGGGGGGAPRGSLENFSGGNGGASAYDGQNTSVGIPGTQAQGGKAPVSTNGGDGGAGFVAPQAICSGEDGLNAGLGIGGSGGSGGYSSTNCRAQGAGGGGGGGGYYGGGGGGGGYAVDVTASVPGAGGGGGSSYIGGVSNGSVTDGANTGNGRIVISWSNQLCVN